MAVGYLGLQENVGGFCDGLQSDRSRSDDCIVLLVRL
jgi:hypothetical protein